MRNYMVIFAFLLIIASISGCGISNNASEPVNMMVIDGSAGLFVGNDRVGSLPAGTQVNMLEKKGKWCVVEIPMNEYNLKVKGLIVSEPLAQAPERASIEVMSPRVSPVYEAKRSEIWSEFFIGNGVNDIALDNNDVWLGTTAGLIKFPASSPSRAVTYTFADGLLDNDILSVDAKDGEVWAGSMKGLNRSNGSGFVKYTSEDGLLNGSIMTIEC